MPVHENSRTSYRKLNTATITAAIFDAYHVASAPMTDREVAEYLGHEDMNAVRPKITALIRTGRCSTVGTTHDQKTDRDVRLVTVYGRAAMVVTPATLSRAALTALLSSVRAYRQVRGGALADAVWKTVQAQLSVIDQHDGLADLEPGDGTE